MNDNEEIRETPDLLDRLSGLPVHWRVAIAGCLMAIPLILLNLWLMSATWILNHTDAFTFVLIALLMLIAGFIAAISYTYAILKITIELAVAFWKDFRSEA